MVGAGKFAPGRLGAEKGLDGSIRSDHDKIANLENIAKANSLHSVVPVFE